MTRRSAQQALPFGGQTRRGARKRWAPKLGRPPVPARIGFVPHASRPVHDRNHPVHVTMKRVPGRASLRQQRIFKALIAQMRHAVHRGVRVGHYSIQDDHIHLVVEADDRTRLARDMQYLFSRIALEVNRIEGRHGKLFRDRHHRRALTTAREVRNALVYVMFNDRKHDAWANVLRGGEPWIDPCSSSMWFDDWDPRARPPPQDRGRAALGPCPITSLTTWLGCFGYTKAGGPIRYSDRPRAELR